MESVGKRRRPWLAALLSLIAPGLGQLYNGQTRRALFFFGAVTAVFLFLMATIHSELTGRSFGFLVVQFACWVLGVLLHVTGIIDAFRQSRRLQSITPRWFNRWYVYLAVFLLAITGQSVLTSSRWAAEPFSAASDSMAPTLQDGDIFYVEKTSEAPVRRGDVIAFRLPAQNADYLKRVVGLSGDTVQMRDGLLYVNGVAAARKPVGDYADDKGRALKRYQETMSDGPAYDIVEYSDTTRLDSTESFIVPPGHLFVLGDNRDNSQDSRVPQVGFVLMENVIGRVTYIFWSDDLGRIGTWVE
jgi:signal peptidase I